MIIIRLSTQVASNVVVRQRAQALRTGSAVLLGHAGVIHGEGVILHGAPASFGVRNDRVAIVVLAICNTQGGSSFLGPGLYTHQKKHTSATPGQCTPKSSKLRQSLGSARQRRSTLRQNLGRACLRRSTLQPALGNARPRDIHCGARKPTQGEHESHHSSVRYFNSSQEGFEKSHLIHILDGIPNLLTKGFCKAGILLLLKFGLSIPPKVFQTHAQPRERSLQNLCVTPSRRLAIFCSFIPLQVYLEVLHQISATPILSKDIPNVLLYGVEISVSPILKRYPEPMAHGPEACELSHLLWPMARRPVSRHTRAVAVDTGCQRDIPVL